MSKTEDVKILLTKDNIDFIKSNGYTFSRFINNLIDVYRLNLYSVGEKDAENKKDNSRCSRKTQENSL